MVKLKMYIDGFNLYHAIVALNQPSLKWLNPIKLAESFLNKGEELRGVHFFTSIATDDGAKYKRHMNYLRAIQGVGVITHEGNFIRVDRVCQKMARRCSFKEEKRTDVSIAVKMLADAYADAYDRLILVTADSDQVPTIEHLKERFPEKHVTVAVPPERLNIARELCAAADRHAELKASRLQACALPRNVYRGDGKFVATMPALYIDTADR